MLNECTKVREIETVHMLKLKSGRTQNWPEKTFQFEVRLGFCHSSTGTMLSREFYFWNSFFSGATRYTPLLQHTRRWHNWELNRQFQSIVNWYIHTCAATRTKRSIHIFMFPFEMRSFYPFDSKSYRIVLYPHVDVMCMFFAQLAHSIRPGFISISRTVLQCARCGMCSFALDNFTDSPEWQAIG